MNRNFVTDPTQNAALGHVIKQERTRERNYRRALAYRNRNKTSCPKCFALSDKGCRVLIGNGCSDPEACAFYMSDEEARQSREKANRRLASLDRDQQVFISEKYYAGKMPWKEDVR